MSINLSSEKPITFGRAARLLPKSSRPSYATWWRWWRRGIRGVHLETVLIGGKRYTTVEAMQRFVAALSAPSSVRYQRIRSSLGRDREQRFVEAELRKEGIL